MSPNTLRRFALAPALGAALVALVVGPSWGQTRNGGDTRDYGYGDARTTGPAIDLRGRLGSTRAPTQGQTQAQPQAPIRAPAQTQAQQASAAARTSGDGLRGAQPSWLAEERAGAPYEAHGRVYAPTPEPDYAEEGGASVYAAAFAGRPTAAGEVFDPEALSAAHQTLPIPCLVQVTNLANGREMIVRVNDRGPFSGGAIIGLSPRAADVLGLPRAGGGRLHVRYLGPAPKRLTDVAAAAQPGRTASSAAQVAPVAGLRGRDVGFVVQVGVFGDRQNAARARTAASRAGPVSVQTVGAVEKVFVGPWHDRNEAEAARRTLASLGYANAAIVSATR